ncbi:hypothetical protein GEMRC1_004731 [Eukaryota sp. GEM-RC1]
MYVDDCLLVIPSSSIKNELDVLFSNMLEWKSSEVKHLHQLNHQLEQDLAQKQELFQTQVASFKTLLSDYKDQIDTQAWSLLGYKAYGLVLENDVLKSEMEKMKYTLDNLRTNLKFELEKSFRDEISELKSIITSLKEKNGWRARTSPKTS